MKTINDIKPAATSIFSKTKNNKKKNYKKCLMRINLIIKRRKKI
jgi:hypothetical protein